MDKITVLILGIGAIAFVLWYFLGNKKTKEVVVSNKIEITVEGGYTPDKIVLKKGETTTLIFNRKDPSDCLEEVVIPKFKIRKSLNLNQKTEIKITPENEGEFGFECGMGMFKGKIIVK